MHTSVRMLHVCANTRKWQVRVSFEVLVFERLVASKVLRIEEQEKGAVCCLLSEDISVQ